MTTASKKDRGTFSLEDKVDFLSRPESYDEKTAKVEAVETYMSWVFLTDRHVFKLKKPVTHDYLDFSTIGARQRNCQVEVRLNRRLAPDVYLDVLALVETDDGRLQIGVAGRPVDWLVHMRRLPADRMLDSLIEQDNLHVNEIERVARRLADFYRNLPPADITIADYVGHFERELQRSLEALATPGYCMPVGKVETLHSAVVGYLSKNRARLEERVDRRRIVEGHGDLRPEHVCLTDPPAIIDCLEFSRRLRLVDPFDELAFLAIECERLGAPWVGATVLGTCSARLQDVPATDLIDFYKCFRALLRSRLVLRHLNEPSPRRADHWPRLAETYITLAEGYARGLSPTGRPSDLPVR